MTPLLVALGAALGTSLRYLAGHFIDGRAGFHLGTLLVNVLGSFFLGVLAGQDVSGQAMALLGTGFCGGFTTYSAFAVQSFGQGPRRGTAYVAMTLVGSLLAAWLGLHV